MVNEVSQELIRASNLPQSSIHALEALCNVDVFVAVYIENELVYARPKDGWI